ncbi:MAG: acyltransferase family protein [Gammaproteobacteria bacterium]
MFFVISGFLITRNILEDHERGRFSIADFYRRRVKRIAPAMLVVVAVTLAVSQLIFLPEDAETAAESALWAVLSLANVYFWLHQDTSYFAADSAETPLLHLWSLSVEEQFYVFWPLLLLLLYRPKHGKRFAAVTLVVAIGSFFLGQLLFAGDPLFVYYMLPTRAGELLLGALVSFAVLRGVEKRITAGIANSMAFIGFVLTIGALFSLSKEAVFPGLRAFPPAFGTALLILAGHCSDNWLTRALALRPMRWVGLVSYSAYLWHWPLLAAVRYGHTQIGLVSGVVIFVGTFVLAWITYTYIEQPARRSSAPLLGVFTRQFLVPGGALLVLALGAMYADGFGLRWFSKDYRSRLAAVRGETRPAYQYEYVCQRQRILAKDTVDERCVVGADSTEPPVGILLGDSNAAHLVGMLGAFAAKGGFRLRNVAHGSCPPLRSDPKPFVSAKHELDCRESLEAVRPAIDSYSVVVISAAWSSYYKQSHEFRAAFFETVQDLTRNGKLVVLIGQVPEIANYDRRCREKALSYSFMQCPHVSATTPPDFMEPNASLRAFAERTENVEFFDVTPYLCSSGSCPAFGPRGNPLYYDHSHLTLAASWELGSQILSRDGLPEPFAQIPAWANRAPHAANTPRHF